MKENNYLPQTFYLLFTLLFPPDMAKRVAMITAVSVYNKNETPVAKNVNIKHHRE